MMMMMMEGKMVIINIYNVNELQLYIQSSSKLFIPLLIL